MNIELTSIKGTDKIEVKKSKTSRARRLAISVDIGKTTTRACLGQGDGKIIQKNSCRTTSLEGADGFVNQVITMISSLLDNSGPIEEVEAIGIATFGPLDLEKGTIVNTSHSPKGFISLREPLEDTFGRPVLLLNDATAATLGEYFFGAGQRHANLVYLTLSTGIGAGILVDGHLLLGKDGNAGEVGHMTVDPAERLSCGCGKKGHWEAYCSGQNLPNFAKLIVEDLSSSSKLGRFSNSSLFGTSEALTSEIICREARNKDELAQKIIDEVGKLNTIALANIINIYDPSLVTIGGAVCLKNPDLILPPILKEIDNHLANRRPEIITTPLGDDASLLGALAAALKLYQIQPT